MYPIQINYLAVLLATIVQFALGFVWFGPIFGKLWGEMHGFDKLPKEVQKKMMKAMGSFYSLQALVTLVSSFVLTVFITYQPTWNPYGMAFFLWLGFVVPTQVSGVIFGGTESKWIFPKIAVLAGGSLIFLEAAATVISLMH